MDDLMKQLAAAYARYEMPYPGLKAVTLAQWLLESGRGTSRLAREHLNFAGLKWREAMAPFATRIGYAAHDGAGDYCRFASVEAFIRGYWAFIARAPYAGWERHVETAASFIGFVGPIYTPTPGYAARVLALVAEARGLLEAAAGAGDDLGAIVIDPGHGGAAALAGSSANNAVSVSGVREKALTLDFEIGRAHV